ncbi:hypothetical protein BD779DRAFT_1163460 [Infundibulicybe gibba]|nr:hypothetical protein BD779DRAFT_1163460 [Infundibulicybe gibba]
MHLRADIICFQEMKSSRPALPRAVAVPPSFHAFFSFPLKKSGYSCDVYSPCSRDPTESRGG